MDETVKQNIQSMIDSAIQNGITAGMSILVRKDNKYVCFIMHKPNDITLERPVIMKIPVLHK